MGHSSRSGLSLAVKIVTRPPDGSAPKTYRWAMAGRGPVEDTATGEQYVPLITPGSFRKSLGAWERPVSVPEVWQFTIPHYTGEWWGPAIDQLVFAQCEASVWWAWDGAFDSTTDPLENGMYMPDDFPETDASELRFRFEDLRGERFGESYPTETVDVTRFPNAATASKGKELAYTYGVLAGSGAVYVQPECIDVGEDGGARPQFKIYSTRDGDGNDTLGSFILDTVLMIYVQVNFPAETGILFPDPSVDGPFRVVPRRSWDGDRPLYNWISPDARTIPADAIINKVLTSQTFRIDLPHREQDSDPGPSVAVDSLGRAVAVDIDPETDVIMVQALGSTIHNPEGDLVISAGNVLCRWAAYDILAERMKMPTSLIAQADYFTPSEWPEGPGENDGSWGAEYITSYWKSAKPFDEWFGAACFEGNAAGIWRNGQMHYEPFRVAPPASASIIVGPKEIERLKVIPGERFAPYANQAIVNRKSHNEATEELDGSVDLTRQEEVDRWKLKTWTYDTVLINLGAEDHFDPDGLERWTNTKLGFLIQREVSVECRIRPPTRDALRYFQGLEVNRYIALWWNGGDHRAVQAAIRSPWIAEEAPEVFRILEIEKDGAEGLIDLGLQRVSGNFARYAGVGTAVFPATLSGETGYGSGDASVWDPAWSDVLKYYARTHWGYYVDPATGRIDPTDPDSEGGSVYGG